MATDVELTVELGKLMQWEDVDDDNYVIDNDNFAITVFKNKGGVKEE